MTCRVPAAFCHAASLLLACAGTALAQPPAPLLGTNERAHLDRALDALAMTEADLAFTKDVAEPVWALRWVRDALTHPLRLPEIADRIRAAAATNDPSALWTLAGELLEADVGTLPTNASAGTADATIRAHQGVRPTWQAPLLDRFLAEAGDAAAALDRAFAGISADDRRYLAASCLAGAFYVEDHPERLPLFEEAGMPSQAVARVLAEALDLDPRPAVTNYHAAILALRVDQLLSAGRTFAAAVDALAAKATGMTDWPTNPVRLATPLGDITVGTPGPDRYDTPALLILDPGGSDVYAGRAGAANGLAGRPLAAVVDLAGDDVYESAGLLAPGSAVFGLCHVRDEAGSDLYRADYAGQAAAVFGCAWIEDAGGDDVYRAYSHAQAAAASGFAVLRDRAGNDTYAVGLGGQACAGVQGVALLLDDRGNDRYAAGGREPDHERYPERFLSLAQGFAIGGRPFFGGGAAALVDAEGNDTYEADVYGQGAGYWYAAGFLLDGGGHDAYRLYHYGQGSGIHLALGLLADDYGDDAYSGFGLVQGNAHDYGVGFLLDRAGRDTYTAESGAQGRGINNALGVLIDGGGDDGYFGRLPDECQGIGHPGGHRDYGCLSLLLDLGGADRYTCAATNGARLRRPLYGIVYDAEGPAKP